MNRMESKTPARKVTVATLGSAVVVIVVWLVNEFVPGVEIPTEIKNALVVLATFGFGYAVRPGASDRIV